MKIIRLSGGPRLIPPAYADDETNKMVLFFLRLREKLTNFPIYIRDRIFFSMVCEKDHVWTIWRILINK